jgi:hypothetical protein
MGNPLIAATFSGSVCMPSRPITYSRTGSFFSKKKHFSGLSFNPDCRRRRKTCSK